MRYEITRKIKNHFPEIKADRSGSGAHLIDKGDDWTPVTPQALTAEQLAAEKAKLARIIENRKRASQKKHK